MNKRRGIFVSFATGAVLLAMASAAFACVTFMGDVEVEGEHGSTQVVGTGNSHGYCSDGQPTTAAAGHLDDPIRIKVKPGSCDDVGALTSHQLPEGTYQVRINNEESYLYDGTHFNHKPAHGCFHPANVGTSSVIGTFNIDASGYGQWDGSFGADDLKGAPYFSVPTIAPGLPVGTASNLCIGASGKGMLTPYQVLAI